MEPSDLLTRDEFNRPSDEEAVGLRALVKRRHERRGAASGRFVTEPPA
jgi:hypothetical protein